MLIKYRLAALLALLVFVLLICPRARSQTMIEPHAQAMPLLPFLDYLADPSHGMDIEEVARSGGWQPLLPGKLPLDESIIWLRFTIAPLAPDARPRTFLLDLGQSVPGTPVMYDQVRNELSGALEWRENLPASRNILLLPEAAAAAEPCYIRMNGLPGPWFVPMIRTPQNAASNWSSLAHAGSILALAVIMAVCLMRGLTERGQWRYWIALFVGASLLQVWLGMPAFTDRFSLPVLGAIMLPGIALMFLPHAARHLLEAKKYSRPLDIQLFLLSLPGAILALLPLLPGWDWLNRWLALWPLGTLLFIPTALAGWLSAIPGARRFLLACCIPPLFTAFAWFGFDFGLPANVLASGPAWGIFFAALVLVASITPQAVAPAAAAPAEGPVKTLPVPDLEEPEEVISLEHPLDDPNLRIIPAGTEMKQSVQTAPVQLKRLPRCEGSELEIRENAMREPLDELLRESANLERCSLPPSARKNVENVIAAAEKLATILSHMPLKIAPASAEPKSTTFNLQHILRNAHNSVAPGAEHAGIALSWYMPPHLPQIYAGDPEALESTLAMLLESAVRSAQHGAIKLSARRVPDSADPGHLLFTVTDNGCGYPPLERSSLALARAWELTGQYNGYLSAEASQHGSTIAFTAHFMPVSDGNESQETTGSRVLLIGNDAVEMRNIARIMETIPAEIIEVSDAEEAVAAQTREPAPLLVATGQFARPATSDMIRKLTRIARDKGITCRVLAITRDESEWSLLKASGFTHAMVEPVDPDILKQTVQDLTTGATEEPAKEQAYLSESETLSEARPIKSEQAPSMLIEQNFPISPVFEGPEWLGEAEEAPEADKPAPPRLKPSESKAPESAIEWVGEPTPVRKPEDTKTATDALPRSDSAHEPEKPVQPAQAAEEQPETAEKDAAMEWVGEPMPMPKAQTGSVSAKDNDLLNFVLDINEAKTEPAPDTATTHSAGRDEAVKNFVEKSVSMVENALNSMLHPEGRQEQGQPKPAPEPGGTLEARSDPALIALLDRMDKAMGAANAAFTAKNCPIIAQSTAIIAKDAENFGLRLLARMAKCVERAAAANDMTALADLLPELDMAVERNRITLAQKRSTGTTHKDTAK